MPIRELDAQTINAIAAGEVIERPASVIKELVENAIDAHANRIEISIINGGISEIRVQDNGCGIAADECEIAFKNHATSKLSEYKDLFAISSMGFRGEALASIAAISKTKLISKPKEQANAYCVEIAASQIKNSQICAANSGTQIIVRDLFYNVPARHKFLKSASAETQAIAKCVSELALSAPNIAFRLSANDKLLLQTPGNNDLLSTIQALFGKEVADNLIKIQADPNFTVQVSGFIGQAAIAKKTRKFEFFFVNERSFHAPVALKALEDAYKSFIMTHQFPVAFLYLDLPNNLVDVNVHPRKLEVRFWDEAEVYRAIYQQVKASLQAHLTAQAIKRTTINFEAISEESSPNKVNYINEANSLREEALDIPENSDNKNSLNIETAPISASEVNNSQANTRTNGSALDLDYKFANNSSKLAEQIPTSLNYANNLTDDDAASPIFLKSNTSKGAFFSEKNQLKTETTHLNNIERYLQHYQNASNNAISNHELISSSAQVNKLTKPQPIKQLNYQNLVAHNWTNHDLLNLQNAEYMGQFSATYLIFNTANELIILDQHAVHERIIFEELTKLYKIDSPNEKNVTANLQENRALNPSLINQQLIQKLLIPYPFTVDGEEHDLIAKNANLVAASGYELKELKTTNSDTLYNYELSAIPLSLKKSKSQNAPNLEQLLQDLLEDLRSYAGSSLNTSEKLRRILASRACRSAVMAGDYVTADFVNDLKTRLLNCLNPYQCPHGRPTLVKLNQIELAKSFKRRL